MSRGGGAVFVLTGDGDLDVYPDAWSAGGSMEAVDVDDGEYAAVYRVDGAVLVARAVGEVAVVLELTGEVDAQGLSAVLDSHADRLAPGAGGGSALDVAHAWLDAQWQRRAVRWPRWLDRRLHGVGPPGREELAAPPARPQPGPGAW